jgi:hypothetical protein
VSEIAVVEALQEPNSGLSPIGACSLKVKPVEVTLGHQRESSYVVSYGPARHCKQAGANWVYVYDQAHFEVKRGDRMLAMLTPAMAPPRPRPAYIATGMDHANDALVESVRQTVAAGITASARGEAKP